MTMLDKTTMDAIAAQQDAVTALEKSSAVTPKFQQVPYVKGAPYFIDQYEGPLGLGYIIWQERTLPDGTVQRLAINVGPETERTSKDWMDVPELSPVKLDAVVTKETDFL